MGKITKYNKLVRDKIPEILKRKGIRSVTHTAEEKEYLVLLVAKLEEEVREFVKNNNEEEIADILEVLNTLIKEKGLLKEKIEKIRLNKLKERGGFKKKIILEQTEE